MSRTNAEWLCDLSGENPARDRAIADLRAVLVKGASAAMTKRNVTNAFVEDVVQESLVKLLDRLDQFADRSRFTTWAMSITIRDCITALRRKHWQDTSIDQVTSSGELMKDWLVDEGISPEQNTERADLVQTLQTLINDLLSEKQREAIQAELSGMPQEEIARRTGSNRNAIYKLVFDARKKLKSGLQNSGYSAEDVIKILT